METTLIVKRLVNELRRVRMVMMVMMAVMVAGCNMKPGVTIMSGGKSDYVIYVADTANHQIMRAANLLQTYLKKIGGAELPIKFGLPEVPLKAFLINPDARTGHEDAFSIVTMEKQIFITGGTHKGCIYGVVIFSKNNWAAGCMPPDLRSYLNLIKSGCPNSMSRISR
jgi:hypothetical protein